MRYIVFLLSLLLISCSTKFRTFDLEKLGNRSVLTSLKNRSSIDNFKGSFNVIYTDRTGKQRSSGDLYFDKDKNLILTIDGVVGETEFLIFGDGDSIFVENYFEDHYFKEAYHDSVLSYLASYPISFSEVENILTGFRFENLGGLEIGKVDSTSLEVIDKDRGKHYTFNQHLNLTTIKQFFGNQLFRVTEIDYYFIDKGRGVPRRIKFKDILNRRKLTLFFGRITINETEFEKPKLKRL